MFLRRHFVKILILILVVIVGGGILVHYNFFRAKSPDEIIANEAKDLAEAVGKIAVVPADELPTIATVSDPEALKGQSFFIGAKLGDKVLIYAKAKKAVLYDPVLGKIINITPLNIGPKTSGTTTP